MCANMIRVTSVQFLLNHNKMIYCTQPSPFDRPCAHQNGRKWKQGSEPGNDWRQERHRAQREMYVHNRFPSRSLSHNAVGMFWIIEPGELLSPHFKRHGNKGWILNVCNLWRRPLYGGSKSHPRLKSPTFGLEDNPERWKVWWKKGSCGGVFGVSWMCLLCTLVSVGSSLSRFSLANWIPLWKGRREVQPGTECGRSKQFSKTTEKEKDKEVVNTEVSVMLLRFCHRLMWFTA